MVSRKPPPTDVELALEVQYHYPQIYLACHRRHIRRRSSEHHLSSQDSAYLAHLHRHLGTRPGDLASHLGIGVPTLSAWVKRMQKTGYLERSVCEGDRRRVELRLTPKGEAAMQAASVLDTARLLAVLRLLDPAEKRQALRGLKVLAKVCRRARLECATNGNTQNEP